jgi:cation:H+ antiporter
MLLSVILLVVGLALLIGGADLLVRGVSALAAAIGVSPLIIGLTVVAFGTSTPEIVVNTVSALRGETSLAFGNIVGACALNIGFVLAISALIRPLDVHITVITREIPMLLLAVAAILIMSEDVLLNGNGPNVLHRGDGLILLLLFSVFLYYITLQAVANKTSDPLLAEISAEAPAPPKRSSAGKNALIMVAGMVGVGIGGRMTVSGAVALAEGLGVPREIIGLTLISFGTTLPELTTSVIAARRGHADIAIGNVVGSCIFNIVCIGGIVATIHPISIPPGGRGDLLLLALLSFALWPIVLFGTRRISRLEGGLLLGTYLVYTTYRTLTASGLIGGIGGGAGPAILP